MGCFKQITCYATAMINLPSDIPLASQYTEQGLNASPTLDEIEPVALRMMRSGEVLGSMSLVLGRDVAFGDLKADPFIARVARLTGHEPEHAYALLRMKVVIENFGDELRAKKLTD